MKKIDDTKIGVKLIGSYLIIAVLMILLAYVGISSLSAEKLVEDEVYLANLLPIDALHTINSDVLFIRGDLAKYFSYPAERKDLDTSISSKVTEINTHLEEYKKQHLLTEEQKALSDFESSWIEYQKEIEIFKNNINSGNTKAAEESLSATGDMDKNRKQISDSLENIITIGLDEAEKLDIESDALVGQTVLTTIFITIVTVVIAIIMGIFLTRGIIIPLGKGVTMMQEMALGHLSTRLHLHRKDEIGVLADAMDTFSEDLQMVVVAGIQKIAAGDLSLTVSPKDERDEISPAMVTMLDTLKGLVSEAQMLSDAAVAGELKTRGDATKFEGGYRQIVEGVNATLDSVIDPINEAMRLSGSYAKGDYTDRVSDQLSVKGDFIPFKEALNQIGIAGSSAIGGVKSEVESLTAGMEETNASAEEVASTTSMLAQSSNSVSVLAERSGSGIKQTLTAMEDLSNTVSSVATKAEQATSMAKQTVDLSEKGVMLAGKAEKGMEGIMHSVDETSVIITDITSQMEEIGKIVDVITGIAEQTGLLALNAAIEAARAGDAGMGFAVVADEVKSLALESQKSAENIASIIGNLQKKSQKVSESMKVSATEVKAGNDAVTETLGVFNQIVQSINVVHNNMTEVAGATEEQAAAVEEITASVHEVGSLVQQTAKEAVDSAAATEEVTASIDQITRAISEAAASVQKISDEMGKFTVS
jgi:methyl-accepting chemotaxis protein